MWVKISTAKGNTSLWINLEQAAIIKIDEEKTTAFVSCSGAEYSIDDGLAVSEIEKWLHKKAMSQSQIAN